MVFAAKAKFFEGKVFCPSTSINLAIARKEGGVRVGTERQIPPTLTFKTEAYQG
jgi:hypothetical protein